MKEEWRDIPGYEGLYKVSNTGKILSLDYAHRGYAQELVPKVNNKGYLWVQLKHNNQRKDCLIHRLVAEAFIDNPNGFPLINHKDENKKNNNSWNLEWCTRKYNANYSLDRHPERRLEISKLSKMERSKRGPYRKRKTAKPTKYTQPVVQKDMNGNVIREFENIAAITREIGYCNSSILGCCNHSRKTAYGYKWEFEN